jgi:hypothetical protein
MNMHVDVIHNQRRIGINIGKYLLGIKMYQGTKKAAKRLLVI